METNTVWGDLNWIKKAGWVNPAPPNIYAGGFSNALTVAGSRYLRLTLVPGPHVIAVTNGLVTLDAGNLSGPIPTEFDWTDENKLVFEKAGTTNNPNAPKTNGKETFNPPTMKKNGVINAYATVLKRFLTSLTSESSVKYGDMNNPRKNAGKTA